MLVGFWIAFAVTAAYWPGIGGAATSPRWIVAAFSLSLLLLIRPQVIRMTWAHLLGLCFVLWSALTLGWSETPPESLGAMIKLLVLVAAFAVGSSQIEDPKPVFIGSAAALAISGVIAVAQVFGWEGLPQVASPSGLFVNRNFYAETCAVVAVGVIAYRLWWWLPIVAPGLVLTHARGALLAVLCAAPLALPRRYRSTIAALVMIGAALAVMAINSSGRWESISERLDLWIGTLFSLSFHGAGIGSFWESGPRPIALNYHFEHAHNELLEVAFETGVIGLVLFVVFIASLKPWRVDVARVVLVTLAVESLVGFPLHEPATGVLGALLAGYAARDLEPFRNALSNGRDRLSRRLVYRNLARSITRSAQAR